MSSLICEITKVTSVNKLEDTEKLFAIGVKGWTVISAGIDSCHGYIPRYDIDSEIVYIPPDSVLDEKFINWFFAGGKIKPDSPTKHRVRVIRLIKGKYISEGIILDPKDPEILSLYPELKSKKVGDDVSKILNIVKYEPPVRDIPGHMQATASRKKNPHFKEYTDIENFKWYPDILSENEEVYVTTKRHGTSSRYGWLPTTYDKWWKKLLNLLGLMPKWEFAIGSRRVQIHLKGYKNGFYDEDLYSKIAKQYNFAELLKNDKNTILFGEIIGSSVQGSYTYGCKPGEQKFEAYDVMVDGSYLDCDQFFKFCQERSIPTVPLLYKGPYDKSIIEPLRRGDDPDQKIREGIVIKPTKNRSDYRMGRLVLKWINDDYLTQKQEVTDFH